MAIDSDAKQRVGGAGVNTDVTSSTKRQRVAAATAIAVVLLAVGVVAGRWLFGPGVTTGYVTAIESGGAVCLADTEPDVSSPFYGQEQGLIGGVDGSRCARVVVTETLPALQLGQRIRASVIEVPAVDTFAGGRFMVDYEVVG
jgi:hypothetical protein